MQFINEAIKKEAEKIFQAKTEGETTLDILAKIYADSLPDKTLAQGRIMGEGILQEIQKFDADYKVAQTNQDIFINTSSPIPSIPVEHTHPARRIRIIVRCSDRNE